MKNRQILAEAAELVSDLVDDFDDCCSPGQEYACSIHVEEDTWANFQPA